METRSTPAHTLLQGCHNLQKHDVMSAPAVHAIFKWKKQTIFAPVISLAQKTPNWLSAGGRQAEHWNLKCWWVLKGNERDYSPAPSHPFPHSFSNSPMSCTSPVTILLTSAWGRAGPIPCQSCCTPGRYLSQPEASPHLLQGPRIIQTPRLPQYVPRHLSLLSPDKNSQSHRNVKNGN